jgi:hypothetical protein
MDGESVCGRSAAQSFRGLRAWRGQLSCPGYAVWRELVVCAEGGAGGTAGTGSAVTLRSFEPRDRRGSEASAGTGRCPARYHHRGVARAGRGRHRSRHVLDLGAALDPALDLRRKKSRSTPLNKTPPPTGNEGPSSIRSILTIAPERLVFLDESGVTVGMTRRFAAALADRGCVKARPRATGRW